MMFSGELCCAFTAVNKKGNRLCVSVTKKQRRATSKHDSRRAWALDVVSHLGCQAHAWHRMGTTFLVLVGGVGVQGNSQSCLKNDGTRHDYKQIWRTEANEITATHGHTLSRLFATLTTARRMHLV